MHSRAALACFGAPVVVGLAGLVVAFAIRGDLPDRIAVHRGPGGPHGFGSQELGIALVAVGPLLGLLVAAVVVALGRPRLAAALGTGVAVGVTFAAVGALWGQRGLPDPRTAPAADGVIVIAAVLALVFGAAAWTAVSGPRRSRPAPS